MTAITLPARADRAAAEALLPELAAAVGTAPVAIDATAVQQASLAMLQLLVSARRSGAGAMIVPSSALLDAAMLTGLSAELFDEAR